MDLKKEIEEIVKNYKEEIKVSQDASDKNTYTILMRDFSNFLLSLSSIKLAED